MGDNHADSGGGNVGIGESRLDGAAQAITVRAEVKNPGGFSGATRAKEFAKNIPLACAHMALTFEHQGSCAFAKNGALSICIKRAKCVAS